MNPCADASCLQVLLQVFTVLHSDYIKMIDASGPRRFVRRNQALSASEKFVVVFRDFAALPIPLFQITKLHREESGLDRIQPSVVALNVVIVLLRLAVVAEHANFLRQLRVVSCYGSGFAASTQVLAGIKAEGSSFAHGSRFLPTLFFSREILGSVGLAGIFYHHQIAGFG